MILSELITDNKKIIIIIKNQMYIIPPFMWALLFINKSQLWKAGSQPSKVTSVLIHPVVHICMNGWHTWEYTYMWKHIDMSMCIELPKYICMCISVLTQNIHTCIYSHCKKNKYSLLILIIHHNKYLYNIHNDVLWYKCFSGRSWGWIHYLWVTKPQVSHAGQQ